MSGGSVLDLSHLCIAPHPTAMPGRGLGPRDVSTECLLNSKMDEWPMNCSVLVALTSLVGDRKREGGKEGLLTESGSPGSKKNDTLES